MCKLRWIELVSLFFIFIYITKNLSEGSSDTRLFLKILSWIIATLQQALTRHPRSWSRYPGDRHTAYGCRRAGFVADVTVHSDISDASPLVNDWVYGTVRWVASTHKLINDMKMVRHVDFNSWESVLGKCIWNVSWEKWNKYFDWLKIIYAWFRGAITSATRYFYSETTWVVGIAQSTHHEVHGGGKNPETAGRGIFAPTAVGADRHFIWVNIFIFEAWQFLKTATENINLGDRQRCPLN